MSKKQRKKRAQKRRQEELNGKQVEIGTASKHQRRKRNKTESETISNSVSASIQWLQDEKLVREHLDRIDLFDRLEKSDGLVRIENFLPLHVAEDALKWIKSIPQRDWEVREIDRETSLSNEDTAQHRFFVKKVFPKLNGGKLCEQINDNEVKSSMTHDINTCLDMLVYVIRSIWVDKRCVFSVGKYNDGNYISEHDDHAYIADHDGVMCSRDLAIIYYLTKDWTESDGGVLIDLHEGTRKRYIPKFNSLVAFEVPRFHEVTSVKKRLGRDPRFSIFGWFLEEGNIYSFLADTEK